MPIDDLPPLTLDPVIEFYKKNVDREAIRANLQLSVEERFNKLMERQRLQAEQERAEAVKQRITYLIQTNAGEEDAGAC